MTDDLISSAIDEAAEALLQRPNHHWVVAFSGGKDSTAALKVILAAHRKSGLGKLRLSVIYCDTGVENPILDLYVKSALNRLQQEFDQWGLGFATTLLQAPVQDRFFVRIVGRGYPPPTNSFRWCTNGLRIRPVSRFIAAQDPAQTVLVLGLRQSESQQRDRSLKKASFSKWQKQTEGNKDYDLYLPILNLGVPEVWDAVFWLSKPRSIDPATLEKLYRDASGECPVIKAPTAPPCASGRFGCWTCTVVRKDKSAKKLIDAGYEDLRPYFEFRNWLAEIRNDPSMRWPTRRNGTPGLGPFTLEARKMILQRIDALEVRTRTEIVDSSERGVIAGLWEVDEFARLNFKGISAV
ncbi:phosphoadenosine phosphosulfate reductase family protein [Rhizobium leguminosarum]|uniref:phosphoadenosine phosphosulfate reductase domain-containing protein n=1 Tax=Rhizobium leguminosarum TaxID=384 RepID=UPI0014418C07|nr:phosphoadenosine phosphosulfate reductase family protein [Rhizobium leguminosarum]